MSNTNTDTEVREKIAAFQREWYSSTEPARTVFDVIDRSTRERTWQQLLAYFLRPANRHGFDAEILESFLQTIERETDIDSLDGSLETVRVDVEVKTSNGKRVDLFLSQEGSWFLCIELKVRASEHTSQTMEYVAASHIGTRPKSAFPEEHHNYLYLAPDGDDQPGADAFEQLSWSVVAEAWRSILDDHQTEDGMYPHRGTAQFAEFLAMVRAEVEEPVTGMEAYYRDVPAAKQAHEDLCRSLAAALEREIAERTAGRERLQIKRKRRGFPQFEHGKYNRIEIDKLAWKAGRKKPTILFEINYHLRPHLGPGETRHRPSVGVNLDIRGGATMKQRLREAFGQRVDPDEYRAHGFGEPFTNTKWHFISKEVLLDETTAPVSDILEAFDVLYDFELVLDKLSQLE